MYTENYICEIRNGKVITFKELNGFDGNLVLPEGVTEICNRAFETAFCGLKKITLPQTLTVIGNQAFSCCEQLIEIIIPEGVKSIGAGAFVSCHSLKKVSIPASVTSIGAGAFKDCGAIEEITVAEGNPVYRSSGNCLIEIKKKILMRGGKNCVIPTDGSVTTIGEEAFSNDCAHPRNTVHSKGINEIVIPEGITKIAKNAFIFNYKLESVVLSDSVKTIEKGAFSGCQKIKKITFGNGLETIGERAFDYCLSLTGITLPDSVVKIEKHAFSSSGITEIVFGKNVKYIGQSAFWRCKNLKKVTFNGSADEIGTDAFRFCYGLETVVFNEPPKTIGGLAFCGCEKLKNMQLPYGLETIGEFAFDGCSSLESVEIPDSVKYIGNGAFGYCSKLANVKLPEQVEFMGSSVFKECPVKVAQPKKTGAAGFDIVNNVLVKYGGKSKDVIIPEGVTKIGAKAFFNKKFVESITLPASLTAIANKGIEKCKNLKSIAVQSGNPAYKTAGNCLIDIKKKAVILGFKDSVIPADGTVAAIGAGAFEGTEIENIVLPEGVKTIGSCAFRYCKELKSAALPKTLKSIGTSAFKYCVSLESVTIPQNVTAISTEAFSECASLTEINFDADCCGDLCVGANAFDCAGKNGAGITVNVGANVQRIPDNLFCPQGEEFTPNIVNAVFAENCVCKSIGEDSFLRCTRIKSVKLSDAITNIGRDAFNGCTSLEYVNIPKSATVIGAYAFNNCVSLKELVIPAGVTKLSYAFYGCGGLEKIVVEEGNPVYHSSGNCLIETETKILLRGGCNSVIPSDGSVTRLDNYSFDKCGKLESIAVPEGVTEIYNNVFQNCAKLKSVTIASTVTYVCNPYFENCDSLESITAAKQLLEKYKYFGFKGKEFGLKNRRVSFSFL